MISKPIRAKAVEAVWQEFHSRLYNFVLKQVNNPADAEDIVQEVFLRIHRGLDGLRVTSSLKSWMFQISRNVIIDYYRSPSRRLETSIDTLAESVLNRWVDETTDSTSLSGNSQKAYQEIANCLDPMIGQLPELYREAVLQVEIDGMTQIAVAKNLGLSISAIKSRVQRGRKKLKQLLEECCYFGFSRENTIIDFQVKRGTCNSCGNQKSKTSCLS